jgi:restriction endonuclease S subunit
LNKKLKDIATITTGLYKKPDPSGEVFYLHGKHFDKWGSLKEDAILSKDIFINKKTEKHLLRDKDILFIAKGENNRACIYYERYGIAVASSLFFVIRVDESILMPEYLQWYINSPSTQSKLELFSRGSHIPSISKKLLLELEVYVPLIPTQKQILKVEKLWQKERKLTEHILTDKESYYQNILINLAKEKSE